MLQMAYMGDRGLFWLCLSIGSVYTHMGYGISIYRRFQNRTFYRTFQKRTL
jgi:hypothetical protein